MRDTNISGINSQPQKRSPLGKIILIIVLIVVVISLIAKNRSPAPPANNGNAETKDRIPPDSLHNSN